MGTEKKLHVHTNCMCILQKHDFKSKGLNLSVSPPISGFPTLILYFLATSKWILGKLEVVWWSFNGYRTHYLAVLSIPFLE